MARTWVLGPDNFGVDLSVTFHHSSYPAGIVTSGRVSLPPVLARLNRILLDSAAV